ncbi:MAG: aminotransferase class V-fold PLP-dependent enzyme [Pseudomonadota bacterium]
MPLDIDFVRSCFPAFAEPSLAGWAHFENAGGSYACGTVIELLQHYYTAMKLQPYAWSEASLEAGRRMDAARERMAAWLNVAPDECHFGPSTSQQTYVLAQAFRRYFKSGDEVIVTNQDHEANIGVFRRLGDEGFTVREWQVDPETGELDPLILDELLNDRTRLVCFTHASNIVASYNPVRDIVDRAKGAGAITVVDGVSYCGHGLPDVAALGADIYLYSLYKVYGPHQGVMTLKRELNDALPNQGHFFNDAKPTARMLPAGPDHAQIAASNGVIDYFESIHARHGGTPNASALEQSAHVRQLFQDHEHHLLQPLLDFLDAHPRARLIGRTRAEERAPTVAIDPDRHPVELAEALAERKIGVSAGHFYAHRLVEALGLDPGRGVLRLSFLHYTDEAEVERLIGALEELL